MQSSGIEQERKRSLWLNRDYMLFGMILAVTGIGGILGSIIAPYFHKHFSFGQVIIATMWIGALTMGLYLFAFNIVLLGMISAIVFISGPIYNVVQFSYRSALIPDELQGRVNSVFRLIAFGGQPVGLVVTGWLLQQFGVTQTIVCFALISTLLAVVATINPYIRHARPLAN
jgi:predicted MFS family arabinose efflux permease